MLANLGADTVALASLALNRFRLTPALARDVDAGSVPLRAVSALRRSIAIEIPLAASVLPIVAWLGTFAPPAAL
jgi:copper resistance protein D